MTRTLLKTVVAAAAILAAGVASASVVNFSMTGTYAQGGVADLSATTIGLGGAGSFVIDPGFSGNYFDFKRPGGGTFSTIDTEIGGYYFLRSYSSGDTIGTANFGYQVSPEDDWDTILVNGSTAGAWGTSHSGYLGFQTVAVNFGWVQYDFTRSGAQSTISFLNGAYDDVAGTSITTSVPEPESYALMLAGLGLLGAVARRKAKKV